jgi:hypothetical protein
LSHLWNQHAISPARGPDLPNVEHLLKAAKAAGLTISPRTKLIAVQHILRTNLALFHALFDLGLQPDNTFVLGKGYSTSPFCLAALEQIGVHATRDLRPPAPGYYEEAREDELRAFWRDIDGRGRLERGEHIIIADVGGRLLSMAEADCAALGRTPAVLGVEQTSSGIRRLESRSRFFPIINVAEAAAKTLHESPLLAETVLERLDRRSPGKWPHVRAGVIGLGDIGQAMIAKLVARGFDALGSDLEPWGPLTPELPVVPLATLMAHAEIVFGCAGADIFLNSLPNQHQSNLILVSCSSEDVEFKTILRQAHDEQQSEWPADDITVSGPCGPITILAGGYPLNFDTSGISMPEQAIQATTALMLAGILTAASVLVKHCEDSRPGFIQLPAALQAAILQDWRRIARDNRKLEGLASPKYLAAHSVGRQLTDQTLFERTAETMRDAVAGTRQSLESEK